MTLTEIESRIRKESGVEGGQEYFLLKSYFRVSLSILAFSKSNK